MIPKENEIGRVFTCDEWEYRFIDRKDAHSDDFFDAAKLVLEEIFAQNNHSEDDYPGELPDLKEALSAIPLTKKESSSDCDKAIVLKTYLGNDSEIICPKYIDGYDVVRLSSSLFSKCKNTIRKLTIPPSVQQISEAVFRNCPELETIEILGVSEYYDVIDGCLYEKRDCAILFCNRKADSITIPESVRQIGTYTFSDCNILGEVNITPNKITLPKKLFIDCTGLKTIRLPNSFASFAREHGVLSRDYPGTAYNLDLTRCSSLSDVYYDGTWEQWLQKPVCVCGTVTVHVQDGSIHNDRRREDFFSDLMAKFGWNQKTDS